MKVLMIVMLLAVTGLISACQKSAKVRVECKIDKDQGYACEVNHFEGKAKAKACWDAVTTCQNGTKAIGSGCHEVEPGAKAQHLIPFDEIKNAKECDKPVGFDVTNIKVTIVD